jgi:hypothetical protein
MSGKGTDPALLRAQKKRYRDRYPDKMKAQKKRYRERHLEKARRSNAAVNRRRRLSFYGLSEAEFEAIESLQGGRCKLCGGVQPGRLAGRHLCVDHCHATGRVRGLLCSSCNRALGLFRENAELLRRAVDYISAPLP